METEKLEPGTFVNHLLIPNLKLLVLEKSEKYVDYYYCRYFSGITGQFHTAEFYRFELSLARLA